MQLGSLVARGEWDDLDFLQSSTCRELKAVRLTLESFACHLTSKECKHRSDNQGAISIMCIGSSKEHLQCEATKIYAICRKYGILLFPEWVPRHLNTKNMGSKQYGVDHLNMEINKFTLERKVYHSLNQSECRTSVMIIFRVSFTRY